MWIEIGHILNSFFISAVPNGLEICYRVRKMKIGYLFMCVINTIVIL